MKKTITNDKLLESLIEKDGEIKELKKEISKLKETLLEKFMEGDEAEDDGGDGGDEDSADDEEEDEEADPEEKAEEMSDNVLQNLNVPKNLVLDDGTQTNIAVDSSQGNVDVGRDEEDAFYINYSHGNWDYFSKSARDFSGKITTIRQTVTPLLEKALIELIGNTGAFERVSFNATAGLDDDKIRMTAEYLYQIDLYIVTGEENKANVMHDQGYIYQTLAQIPGIKIGSTKIDTDTGNVTVVVTI